jgi:hypothetical protein
MQITLHNEAHRRRAIELVTKAPLGWRITVEEPKRSNDQNRKLWAMIGDILDQKPDWFGPGMDAEDIKQVFMSSLFKELRMARNADGDGYVPLQRRSSRLTVKQMAGLLTLIEAWGARNGVVFHDGAEAPAGQEPAGSATA